LSKYLTQAFLGFFVRSRTDAQRFQELGADATRVVVTGNLKSDNLKVVTPQEKKEKRVALFGGAEGVILAAGSPWPGEEETILKLLHEKRPGKVRIVLAPRRLERKDAVVQKIKASGASWSLWSDVKPNKNWNTDVLLVDTLGDLKDVYAASDLAFVGGSLFPKGGQNPLEPAAARLPIFFGPSMGNFEEEAENLTKAGAANQASTERELLAGLSRVLSDGSLRASMGEAAAQSVVRQQGAVLKTADLIREQLAL
jgi:3-deoxy-D-manno-octulosonic-acid transferase